MTTVNTTGGRSFWRPLSFYRLAGVRAIAVLLVVLNGTVLVADIPVPDAPVETIFGEWQVVEMVHKGKVQDLSAAKNGYWIKLEEGFFTESYDGRGFEFAKRPCRLGKGELDIQYGKDISRGRYDFKGDRLLIILRNDFGERPVSFDAIGDSRVTLYMLERAED